jgi:Kef-type K+ transport system membrane component KefB
MDLHVLNSEVGATILGSAVIDDIIGILLLAFIIGIESLLSAVWVGIRILIFFLIFLVLGLKVIDKVLDLGDKIHIPKALLSISLSILLIYSFFADRAGISGIIGAFVAGILIGNTVRSKKIINDVKAIGYGFFIPLFFVRIGANLWNEVDLNISYLATIGLLSIVIIVIAILGKIVGCGVGAKLSGMTNKASLQVGVGMIPRMELALIIASAIVTHGILTEQHAHQILATTVILTISTTLLAPILIKAVFKHS